MIPEKIKANFRFPMKSIFVFPKISNMLTPSVNARLSIFSPQRDAEGCPLTAVELYAQLTHLLALIHDVENHLGADQCRKEIDRNSQAQGDGETFDRTRAEEKQRDPRD